MFYHRVLGCHVLVELKVEEFRLLREGTSAGENRKTGEKSPTVAFIDFNHLKNNRFIPVCQLKLRILGSEHFIYPDVVLFLNGLLTAGPTRFRVPSTTSITVPAAPTASDGQRRRGVYAAISHSAGGSVENKGSAQGVVCRSRQRKHPATGQAPCA